MRRKTVKRLLALVLTAGMVLTSVPVRAKAAAGDVEVPQPYYEFTFDQVSSAEEREIKNQGSAGENVFASIEGSAEGLGVAYDEERDSKVLALPGGSVGAGRLTLPEGMFNGVTNAGFAFSFWISIDANAAQYSRIFSGTIDGQNQGGWPYETPEFSFVAGSETAGDMADGSTGYNTLVFLPGADKTSLKLVWEKQFARGKWQHVTVSVSPASYEVYLDGQPVGMKYDRNNNTDAVLTALFANDAAVMKQFGKCAIGASVYQDADLKAKVDEFRFYNTALTREQADAAYHSYDVSQDLIDQLIAKVAQAKEKSISFYTEESWKAYQASGAIEKGEAGIENPVTSKNVRDLLSSLDAAMETLVFYDGITAETTFSNAQLAAENTVAKKIVSDGGLTAERRAKLQAAIGAAEAALALEGENAENQDAVDHALAGLREAAGGLTEADLAVPSISRQPAKAVYRQGDKTASLTVEATVGVTGDGDKSLTYQWYSNTEKKAEGGTAITGASAESYTPSAEQQGRTYYYCVVTNANPAIADAVRSTVSNAVLVRVNGPEEIEVPQPYYEYTFDAVTGNDSREVVNTGSQKGKTAKIEGTKEGLGIIDGEARAGKVLNLPGGDTNGAKEGRLSLPGDMFADVTSSGFSFSFWINIDENAGQYSRIFSGTVNGQNSSDGNNGAWDAPEFSFVAGSNTNSDMGEGKGGYNSMILLPDKSAQLKLVWEEQFAKGRWQHVTVSVSPTSYDVYLDGELIGMKYDRNNNTGAVLQKLFADNAAVLKQYADCAIGSSVYTTDKDLKARVDEFRFYNTYLTMEQAEAAYDSYAVDRSYIEALQAKVDEAKAKSVSFYTRDSYQALLAAIAAGEEGIENPVTVENVTGLTAKLNEAMQGLEFYHSSITESTAFSKVQLTDTVNAAKTLIAEGGLLIASENAILAAVETAETALKLTGTEANAQVSVDAALTALRAAIDAAVYEENADTPQIGEDGQPQDAVYIRGNTDVPAEPLTVTAAVSDKGTLSYQWYQNTTNSTAGGTAVEGAVQASYTPSITEAGTVYYYCEVTNTQNKAVSSKTASAKSRAAAVTVKEIDAPQIQAQLKNAVYEVGETAAALTVEASVSDSGTLSYQWYKKASETAAGEAISGATGKSYTPSTAAVGKTWYYCVVTNTIGAASQTAESASVSIHVVEDKSAAAEQPTITVQPADAEYTAGDTAEALKVEATVSDGGTLSYQWYRNTRNSTEGGTAVKGAVQASYTPDITAEGIIYYYCVVMNTKGSASETAVSRAAAITVAKADKPPAAEPQITGQPTGKTYTYGKKATALNVEAEVSDGGTLSYQWYQNTVNAAEGGTAIPDATESTYTPSTKTVGTAYYYCVVTNTKDSETAAINSDIAAVRVEKAANSITGVSAKLTAAYGKTVSLKAKGQGAVTYQSSNTKVVTIGKTNGKLKAVGYGKAQITVKAAGNKNYNSASKKITVTVNPKKMTLSGVKSKKKAALLVTWKKDAKADGYKIQYATDRKFKKGVKSAAIKKNKTIKTTLKKLKAGKKYYVRICAYKGSGKNQVCGSWSKAKSAKVKKK